jgi:fibronectin type 3 domain-containing protein
MRKRWLIVLLVVIALMLQASKAQTQHFVTLTWTAPTGTAPASYNVYRSLTTGTGYTKLANCLTTTLVDNTGVGGTKYFYVVRAVDAGGNESVNSNEATATAVANPNVPTNLTATPH